MKFKSIRDKNIVSDKSGATLAYVAVALTAMLGVVGLSFDLGRHYILSTELQKAADAAAIAGAYQLDPNGTASDIVDKVNAAVDGAPITGNQSRLANSNGIIEIAEAQLLKDIPADDDNPITSSNFGPPYNYVSVTTEAKVSNTVFGRAIGQPPTVTITATAVARRGRAICSVTPLAICNPAEQTTTGAAFDVNDYIGKQILVRAIGNGNQAWAPGNFGFLDVPGFGGGAPGLYDSLATENPQNCYNASVTTEPGQTNGARNALNTRFGFYLNPQPGGVDGAAVYPPAADVYKGFNTEDANHCSNPLPNTAYEALGRDTNLINDPDERFGNGEWNCMQYWNSAHDTAIEPAPTGCTSDPTTNTATRWDVYVHENINGYINDGTTYPTSSTPPREIGAPFCQDAGNTPVAYNPADPASDRRVVTMAVLNCVENSVSGRWTGGAEGFMNGFLTEPVTPTGDMIFEVIGGSASGAGGPVPVKQRDWVEIVR